VSVDGATRAITLSKAPKAGATVTVTYWFNTWQDTYDHLAHVNVQSLTRVGDVPGGSQYIQGADFVLQNDRVMWGTAASVQAGVTTTGSELFDDTQVTTTLIDNKTFMSACSPVLSSQGTPSTRDFQLPMDPTLGNGRDTSLGQSLFQNIANNRIGVPVNRPDVVDVYWGFSVEDALVRGKVEAIKVEGSVVTLRDPVPVGATVYATFYHNRITDMEYTLACVLPGVSGVGTYRITDSAGNPVYTPTFDSTTKSAGLTGVIITFPSGSELTPDLHFEGDSGDDFQGPVEEVVTITFANTQDTPAKFTVAGPAPYAFIQGESDLVTITVNGDTVLVNQDLDTISTGGGGIMAHLVGNEVVYPDGIDFDLADFELGNEDFILTVDGVEITATIEAGANKTMADWAAAINLAADGAQFLAGGATLATEVILPVTVPNYDIDDYFVGWRVVVGNHALGGVSPGLVREIMAYDGATRTATVATWGAVMLNNTPCRIYDPDTVALLKGATRFNGPVDLTNAAGMDTISVAVTTNNTAATTITGSVANATYASASALASALNTAFRGASGDDILTPPAGASPIGLAITGTPALNGLDFIFSADADGRLQVMLQVPGTDDGAFLEFITQAAPTDDLAILAGFDSALAANGQQMKLNVSGIAKEYTITIGGVAPYDRLILRNRIHPGGDSMESFDAVAQCQLLVGAGSGNAKAGFENADYGEAAHGATVLPATLIGRVGFGGGTEDTGEPIVTFYDGSGAQAANNVFEFVIDGQPIRVEFVGSALGTPTDLGMPNLAGTVLYQIQEALEANGTWGNLLAVQATNLVELEGAAIRLNSQESHDTGFVEIGGGSANPVLGFTEGTLAGRTLVTAEVLASALNSDREASLVLFLTDFTSIGVAANEFAAQAVAKVVADVAGRKYLHIASAGPATS
ncbi:hypothetical protein, partial [Mycolicibacterium sp.]|uniref:hypothetical protein n=1 Tax=Mycolicibacterium sp. TaxID=2320850 RepID=UPI00355FE54A